MDRLLLLGIGVLGVAFAVVAERLGRKLLSRPGKLKAHFRRLGQVAPHFPCPCARSGKGYGECCREGDVSRLERDVRDFIFTDWMHRSGGRRRARSMQMRLEDFPIPEVVLPGWVTDPESFTFPIDEQELRSWSPLAAGTYGGGAASLDTGSETPI